MNETPERPPHPAQWLWVIGFSLFFVGYFGCDLKVSAYYVPVISELRQTGVRAKAEVTKFWAGVTADEGRGIPDMIDYEFETPKNRVQVVMRDISRSAADGMKAGRKLSVWYDPKNPHNCMTDLEMDYWTGRHTRETVFLSLTLLVLLGGLVGMGWAIHRRRTFDRRGAR